ncbi:NAD(P)H-quinone oxidoreductase [Pyrinomonas methylaliphatogenes]|uniref:Putative NAD(P)H quinone oxidoreductase, PIG3 family n=1 Tax=Pyrinomonas methylaliphatogenes TaxID=454194 RepID=A0A0B6WYM2_9BACT|nr:NAD(P)H-quinone oxidoreductase [Pyrinomonas methylaliphatogenes]CDM66363.1 putative NAD(P)H quinone oxidoreductase, PIG3 family [Pyrinomonas methylaliphatogenes]
MASKMLAITIAQHGDVDALELREVERPEACADWVRVRVRAAALNRADLLQRRGLYPAPPGAPNDIPGLEFAGEVDQIGGAVQRWRVGQRVFGIAGGGAQAEYLVVPESHLAEIPPNLDWIEAAAVPEVFITAHDALFAQADLRSGESVLIHAVGSGVGTAAIQLVRAAGGIAYGTARTAEKLDRARSLGLERGCVVADDPRVFVEAIRDWTGGAGIDLILDLVGAAYLSANLEALAPLGRIIFVGTLGGTKASFDIGQVMRKRLRLMGTVLRSRSMEEKASAMARFSRYVVPLLARGAVRPVIDSVYQAKDVREAHRRMESNANFGKIVLTFD